MTMRSVRVALGGLMLTLSGCVVAPPPMMAGISNCQQFTQTITVGGNSVPGYGVQCQQPDGTWQVVVPPQQTPPLASAVVSAPGYVYPPPYYVYPYPYDYPYPWYYGPDVAIGFGWGWGGGWGDGGHGGWGGRWYGGWHGGGWGGGGHGGGGGFGGGGHR